MVHFLTKMGQNASLPKGRRKSLRSFRRKSGSHNNNLSHTFTIVENDEKIEKLNINLASEEELMTLPGVNREIARSIVEHRKAIGRFRKIEDLALVRGVGADKLEFLRPEICVSSRKNQSCASSRAQSYDSLRSTDSKSTTKSNKLVNINKGSVFELQSIHGITQEIAAGIVHYREKKGPFKQVNDLIKVKSIDRIRLDNISRFLTVENERESSDREDSRPSVYSNGITLPSKFCNLNGNPLKLPVTNGLPTSSAIDIFELLSAYSPRPVFDVFNFSRNGEPAIRMASWNLHQFSNEKASNLGVKEVVCRTILENGWSVIAIQGVTNVTALKTICEELNNPKLRRVDEWKDKNHNWNFCMLDISQSKLGFIYDSDGAFDIELMSLNEGPEATKQYCEVLIATFSIADLNFQLVNMNLNKKAEPNILHQKVQELISEQDMLMLFIDLSNVTTNVDGFLNVGGLKAVLPASTNTSYVSSKIETSSHHLSNILVHSNVQKQLDGFNGVVRHGFTHLAIPNGWTWGGPASPFCPVWTELFLNRHTGTAL